MNRFIDLLCAIGITLAFIVLLISGAAIYAPKAKVGQISEYSVPYTFSYSNWNHWLKLEHKIEHSQGVVILDWQGRGGHCDLGQDFIRFLHNCSKYVIIKIVGPSQSMHALVACTGNKLIFNQGWMMFHLRANYQYGHDIPDKSQEAQSQNKALMQACVNKGIITERDVSIVNQDKMLYLFPNGAKTFKPDDRN